MDQVKRDLDFNESTEPCKLPFGPKIVGQDIGDSDVPRSSKPHMAIVTMKVDIRAMNPDDTLDLHVMGNEALKKYGISQKAQFVIKGISEADCIRNLKNSLETIFNG